MEPESTTQSASLEVGDDVDLTPRERARLEVLRSLVVHGRMRPGTAEAQEYEGLRSRERSKNTDDPEDPAELPVMGRKAAAAFYQVSDRTAGYWRSAGAPLEEPRRMVSWWAKAFPGKPVNPGILAAQGRDRSRSLGRGSSRRPVEQPVAAAAAETDLDAAPSPSASTEGLAVGFDAAHQRMLEEEARLYARFRKTEEQAREAREVDPELAEERQAEADVARAGWVKLAAAVGLADARQIKNAMQRGDLVHKATVERQFARLIQSHPEVIRHELRGVREQLEPAPSAASWDAAIDRELDDLFRRLPELLVAAADRRVALE